MRGYNPETSLSFPLDTKYFDNKQSFLYQTWLFNDLKKTNTCIKQYVMQSCFANNSKWLIMNNIFQYLEIVFILNHLIFIKESNTRHPFVWLLIYLFFVINKKTSLSIVYS